MSNSLDLAVGRYVAEVFCDGVVMVERAGASVDIGGYSSTVFFREPAASLGGGACRLLVYSPNIAMFLLVDPDGVFTGWSIPVTYDADGYAEYSIDFDVIDDEQNVQNRKVSVTMELIHDGCEAIFVDEDGRLWRASIDATSIVEG